MKQEDHNRLKYCQAAIMEGLAAATRRKDYRRAADLKETLKQINSKLLEPIDPPDYNGEHSVENPFI